jgi:hypothetical protein
MSERWLPVFLRNMAPPFRRNAWATLPTGHSTFLRVLAKKFFPVFVACMI